MNILMVTNTYTPIVGGVERSIMSFCEEFRKAGHNILIIAPKFDDMPEDEEDVIRVTALRRFNGSDFSVSIPVTIEVDKAVEEFHPDIVHSHHPFLLGDTALRIANKRQIPLVFTHHTKYEDYTHYVPVNSSVMKKFVIELSTGYADLADHIIAPSQSIKDLITQRGVKKPVSVIPTGIDTARFAKGDRSGFRAKYNLAADDWVVGHVGRLAEEKNLHFLIRPVMEFLKQEPAARFLVVGKGPLVKEIKESFSQAGVGGQLCMPGVLEGQALIDAYHAMDLFVFASKTETQGMVVTEAMAAALPVIAIDATGVREVVKDKFNGRLLPEEDAVTFREALTWAREQSSGQWDDLKKNARETAAEFAMEVTAGKALAVYEKLIQQKYVQTDIEDSPWAKTRTRLKTEWDLLTNVADAVGSVFDNDAVSQTYNRNLFTRWRRRLNSREWTARLLGLSQSANTESKPGLVMIQIDGLAHKHLVEAVRLGKMPFLRHLMRREGYHLEEFYAGQPSSTPAVQGELFYGVKGAVPSFSYRDRMTGTVFKMIEEKSAIEVERRLLTQNPGLLSGGSSYSNIYSGGAMETHFCSVDLGWDRLWRKVKPGKMFLLMIIHIYSIVWETGKMAWEALISIAGFVIGLSAGKNAAKEINFIATRMFICVLLRDLITFGSRIDIIRGLPVIHLNFLGYDEHAHRRGPASAFARWTLPGIDRCIAKIHKETQRSTRRAYDVWIYSDHGQEECRSYAEVHGRTVHAAVREIFSEFELEEEYLKFYDREGIQWKRLRYLDSGLLAGLVKPWLHNRERAKENQAVVTAMGPIGHVYLPRELDAEEQRQYARRLVSEGLIPTVFFRNRNGVIKACNARGEFVLPQEAADIFGEGHPHLQEVTEDMLRICRSPDSGAYTISGWDPTGVPWTFPVEGGAHGGPGWTETQGFALLPADIGRDHHYERSIRPLDLRRMAMSFLGRSASFVSSAAEVSEDVQGEIKPVRIITYNVHGCKGLDGKISAERIARVLARHNPDIIALQELDLHRPRSGTVDQTHLIAQYLQMYHQFHPAMRVKEEKYGNAVLSRFPMRVVKAETLPGQDGKAGREPRGALWVEVRAHGVNIQLINTHLGLNAGERMKQISCLLGEDYIQTARTMGPVILLGDFNAIASSRVCRKVREGMRDVQIDHVDHQPRGTWFGPLPMRRIDHIFVTDDFELVHVDVPRSWLDRMASDHLPLIADLSVGKISTPNSKG